jgi:hypothetical protein
MTVAADAAGQLAADLAGRIPVLWVDAYVGPCPQAAARALDLHKGHGSPCLAHAATPGISGRPVHPPTHDGRARCARRYALLSHRGPSQRMVLHRWDPFNLGGSREAIRYRHPAGEGPTLRGMPPCDECTSPAPSTYRFPMRTCRRRERGPPRRDTSRQASGRRSRGGAVGQSGDSVMSYPPCPSTKPARPTTVEASPVRA